MHGRVCCSYIYALNTGLQINDFVQCAALFGEIMFVSQGKQHACPPAYSTSTNGCNDTMYRPNILIKSAPSRDGTSDNTDAHVTGGPVVCAGGMRRYGCGRGSGKQAELACSS